MRLPSTNFINRTLQKAYDQHETEIGFRLFDNTRPTNIYGERIGKPFGEPIKALGYFESNPSTLKLQDLGWSKEAVSVLARFPFATLLEAGLANEDGTLKITTNDRLVTPHGKEYEIYEIQPRAPFRNGQPTFVWVGGKNFVSGK